MFLSSYPTLYSEVFFVLPKACEDSGVQIQMEVREQERPIPLHT